MMRILKGVPPATDILRKIKNEIVEYNLAQALPQRTTEQKHDNNPLDQFMGQDSNQLTNEKKFDRPGLAIVLVGSNEASLSYIRKKKAFAKKALIHTRLFHIQQTKLENQKRFANKKPNLIEQTIRVINFLNKSPRYNGIILQLPLTPEVEPMQNQFLSMIDPNKDVDCLGPVNKDSFLQLGLKAPFVPCSISAIMKLIQFYRVDLINKRILIIGKGKLVGDPLYQLFCLQKKQVDIVDKFTPLEEVKKLARESDVIFSATGQQDLLNKEDLKKGCVIIDIGVSKDPKNPKKVRGDFSESLKSQICSFYSPVPKGVGPMVVASLIQNVYKAWRYQK